MKTMYTTKPDKHCYDCGNGYHARPTHTTEQKKLREDGWLYSIPEGKVVEDTGLTWKEEAEIFGIELVDEDGKALSHFKVKALIKEAKANEEGQDS
jgi:hypothetical protein